MEQLLSYLWQSAVVLTVLFIPFQLLLRKEQYFALNRAILLAIMLLCLALPLSPHSMPEAIMQWLNPTTATTATPIIEAAEPQTIDNRQAQPEGPVLVLERHWHEILAAIWLLGAAIFIIRQAKGLGRLYQILHHKDNTCTPLPDGNMLRLTAMPLPSFSWMHSIVISKEDYDENGTTILVHERAHITYHHSLDRLLLLLVQTLQWWNPFVWLMADALMQVHEYQADLAVLNHSINATQYQLLLIRKAAGPAGLSLVNGFKHNKLKLRINMMNNKINLRGAKSRYLALLPVALLAFALTAKAQDVATITVKDTETSATDNQDTKEPLFLVDGEVAKDWKSLDPNTIASVDVYRAETDTAAKYAAIHEAAKNGVVMIQLKEGLINHDVEVLKNAEPNEEIKIISVKTVKKDN